MTSMEFLLSPGWAVSILLIFSLLLCARYPHDKGCERLFLLSFGTFIATLIIGVAFPIPSSHVLTRYDQYAFAIDKIFGEPSFVIGKLMFAHHILRTIAVFVYCTAVVPLYVIICIYFIENKEWLVLMKAFILNAAMAPLIYMVCPVSGPAFAFRKFPVSMPVFSSPRVMHFSAAANGVPSLHFSTALLVLVFAWRWKWGRVFGVFWVTLTFFATLGLGEHYLVDLIAAVLYICLVLYLAGYTMPQSRACADETEDLPAKSGICQTPLSRVVTDGSWGD